MATKKKPSALNAAKLRIQELEARLESQIRHSESLNKGLEEQNATNKALFISLEEARKEKQQFDNDTSSYEGLRIFLLSKLRDKRPPFVNSLFTNVKETINTDIVCKVDKLRERLISLKNEHEDLTSDLTRAESYKL